VPVPCRREDRELRKPRGAGWPWSLKEKMLESIEQERRFGGNDDLTYVNTGLH